MVRSVEARENTNASALYAAFHALTGRIAFRGLSRLPLAAASEEKDPQDMAHGSHFY